MSSLVCNPLFLSSLHSLSLSLYFYLFFWSTCPRYWSLPSGSFVFPSGETSFKYCQMILGSLFDSCNSLSLSLSLSLSNSFFHTFIHWHFNYSGSRFLCLSLKYLYIKIAYTETKRKRERERERKEVPKRVSQ